MTTEKDALVEADEILRQAGAASPVMRRRAPMPAWFADAPDGLDASAKRRLFDDLREQARKATSLANALEICAVSSIAIACAGYTGAPAALAGIPVAVLLALRLVRRPLLHRTLRLHVKRSATW